ncbi:MAG: FG-GAP repeat protein, partial [Gammaproteobacteria bacterium]|nr:FG-GAP repeat protein [Gammaproteobacteria bacterium]
GDGNTLAIGARYEGSAATGINNTNPGQLDENAPNAGAVYVFARADASWTQQAYIKASHTGVNDFGTSVALSADGNTLAVGAVGEDSAATDVNNATPGQGDISAAYAGAAYIFKRATSGWSQQAYVKASNAHEYAFFGQAVALSGDGRSLAVGAPSERSAATGIYDLSVSPRAQSTLDALTNTSAGDSGAVYVYTQASDQGEWHPQAYVKARNADAGDRFGVSVAFSAEGSTLAVGAPGETSAAKGINSTQSDNSAYDAGATYIFQRAGATWAQQAYIKAGNSEFGDNFGVAVSLSSAGGTLAVGADKESGAGNGVNNTTLGQGDNGAQWAGAVYLY